MPLTSVRSGGIGERGALVARFVNHHHGCCGYVPTRPDGSEWAHILVLPSGAVVHADTATDCLEELIEGYADSSPSEQLDLRIAHAHAAATWLREVRVAQAVADGVLTEEERRALSPLLDAPTTSPVHLARPGATSGDQTEWDGPIALVAVTTTYAPHSDAPPLRGWITWIDPSTEESLLLTLGAAGVRNYWRAEAPAAL